MTQKGIAIFALVAASLLALVLLAISRFDWNQSALLHVSHEFGETYKVPTGVVLYEDGGYDGMLYYQIARDIPEIFADVVGAPRRGAPTYDQPYRWQRILLPAFASLLSLGNDVALPLAIIAINIASVLGALLIMLKLGMIVQGDAPTGRLYHVLTIVGNPATLVGILFSLTEPLALFFTTLFLFLWKKAGEHVTWGASIALALALLARETTILLIIPLLFLTFQHSAEYWNVRFRNIFKICLSVLPYTLWVLFLTGNFKMFPLATSEGMLAIPFSGIAKLIQHALEMPNAYVLSSAAFLVFFFLPLIAVLIGEHGWAPRGSTPLTMTWGAPTILLATLIVFLLFLDAHIWGVLTSVGRVLPALYPVYALWALEHDSLKTRMLSLLLMTVSIVAAVGIALTPHPFTIS